MKQVVVVGLLAGVVAGMVRETDATAPLDAAPPSRAERAEARAFPLTGRWRYADSGGLLPRGSGCGPDDAALTLTANGITLTHGPWRQPVFAFADWTLTADADLVVTVASGGSALMERARLTLDLSSAGFVRFKAATAPDGTPLSRHIDARAGLDRDAARAELARLAGALTLLRCPDPTLDTVALLRGPTEAPLPKRPSR